MTRVYKRYRPRVLFYRHQEPSHEPISRAILSEEMLLQSNMGKGKRANIQWIKIRPEDSIDDPGLPGGESNYSTYRPPAIILNNSIRWENKENVGDWAYQPSKQEMAWRFLALRTYKSDLNDLINISQPTDEDREKIKILTSLVRQLDIGGEGYLETAYDLLNSGASGISYRMGVANVPVTVTSTFTTQKNRGQSFRLKRLEAPEGQIDYTFTIEIGNGNSLYALIIGDDGNSSEFVHYRNMTPGKRKKLLDQLEAILDTGRLTVIDRIDIQKWEDEIKHIRHVGKQGGNKLGVDDTRRITSLKKLIEDRKDSKRGLTTADELAKADLEDLIYIKKEKFALQETTKTLLGVSLDFTFHFLRSGYVVIQSKDGRKIYENKRFTGGVPEGAEPVYGDGLPDKAYITVKSNGGKWSLVYGHPWFDNQGTILTQPFYIPFIFQDVNWYAESDSANPGTHITYSLEELEPAGFSGNIPIPPLYQIRIDLFSDYMVEDQFKGRYTPELYYLEFHIPAAEVTGNKDVIWDSDDPDNRWPIGVNRLTDLQIQDDDERCRMCNVYIANPHGQANIPMLLGGAACDVSLYDAQEDEIVRAMSHGYTNKINRGSFDTVSAVDDNVMDFVESVGNMPTIQISGVESFLDKEIRYPITGNNKYVGDYLREMARDMGLPPENYSRLPIGAANGCPRIKKMKPGCFPSVRPALGASAWNFFKDVVSKHAPGWDLWSDEISLKLTKKQERIRTDLQYITQGNAESPLMFRRLSDEDGGISLEQDTRGYWTSCTFIGAMNPLTGMRYSGDEWIPQATLDQFMDSMFYIGSPRHYTASVDEALKSDEDCRKAAREFLNITPLTPQGMPPWSLKGKLDFDGSLRAGDMPTVNGLLFKVESREFSALNSGGKEGQQMNVVLNLAEDKKAEF